MNTLVCKCKMVYIKEIERFVKKYPSATFADLMLATGISTGCGRCRNLAEQQFENFRKLRPASEQLFLDI